VRLVNQLFQEGLIDAAQRSYLEAQGREWSVPPHILLRTYRLIEAGVYLDYYGSVFHVRRIDPGELEWDAGLFEKAAWDQWKESLALPVRLPDGSSAIAAVDPVSLPKQLDELGVAVVLILEEEWVNLTGRFRGAEFLDQSVNGLSREHPEISARRTFTPEQLTVAWGLGTIFLLMLAIVPKGTISTVTCLLNVFYFLCVGFKTLLVFVGSTGNVSQKVRQVEIEQLDEKTLPYYTILVPVYKEPSVIPHLVRQLSNLNYPLCKLDVKVLLEAGDHETIEAFKQSAPPPNFHAIIVPDAPPKTKPKACNYGLFFSFGKYLAIFDAEDLPEADQLEKVIVAFRKLPDHVVCIQGCLNYFNWRENFLTRMFTLEYSTWFDYNLPGMEAMKVPIPLGGTSNHFKFDRLIELGGWDPFNVTEDADLGVRASGLGYTIATIDSTTYEEANMAYGNWIRQRSRWVKGYMQTVLVHTRNPLELIRTIGVKAFLGFLLFIGGTPFIFLVNPILWGVLIFWIVTRSAVMDQIFPPWLLFLSFINLLLGNFLAIYSAVLAVFRRGNYALSVFALLSPFYWILHSIAAYKGLWQLVVNPFYWEKTVHGLSNVKAELPAAAASSHDRA